MTETAVEMPAPRIRERRAGALPGFLMLGVGLVLVAGGVALAVSPAGCACRGSWWWSSGPCCCAG